MLSYFGFSQEIARNAGFCFGQICGYIITKRAYGLVVEHVIRPDFINLKMSYVYILKSNKNNKYYIGSCEDVLKRLRQHNEGLTKSTKSFTPWALIYKEELANTTLARKRELQIKSWKSRVSIGKLINHF